MQPQNTILLLKKIHSKNYIRNTRFKIVTNNRLQNAEFCDMNWDFMG